MLTEAYYVPVYCVFLGACNCLIAFKTTENLQGRYFQSHLIPGGGAEEEREVDSLLLAESDMGLIPQSRDHYLSRNQESVT